MRMIVSTIFLICIVIGTVLWISGFYNMFYPPLPPQLGPVVTIETQLLQPVKNFAKINKLDINKYTSWSDGQPQLSSFKSSIIFSVRPREEGTPSGYAANIRTGHGTIHLPAGGQLWIEHDVGRIRSIESTMPLQTLSFDEVMTLAKQIDENITTLGLTESYINRTMREKEFQELRPFGSNPYGRWDLEDIVTIEMRIKPLSGYSRAAFTNPIGLLPEGPETYLLNFYMVVGRAVKDEIYKLADARAIDLTGNKNGEFPVKIWFDDPDWRPEGWQGQWLK